MTIPSTTPLQLADRLVDALDRAGCVPGVAGLENRMRRVLAEELEQVGQRGLQKPPRLFRNYS